MGMAHADTWQPLIKLAEQGNAEAQFTLGWMYSNGIGFMQNKKEAVRWYHKAAEQGNVKAQHNLGLIYGRGEGVMQDEEEAIYWFTKAAEQGHAEAMKALKILGIPY